MNIYEITGDILKLQEMLLEEPENEAIQDTLESLNEDLEIKAENYVKVIKNMQAEVDAYKTEIDRMAERKRSIENSIERLKKALFTAMQVTETDKIKGDLFTISLRNGAPQLPKELDWQTVPVHYLKEQEPKIDRVELLKAVKSGEVTGIELVKGQSLCIK